jgi:putative FmdB family regulatory protein
MPVYPYRCNACKREFEVRQRMADPDLVKCEVCGEQKLEKLISWASFAGGTADSALYNVNEPLWSDKGKRPQEAAKSDEVPPEQAVADALAAKIDAEKTKR